MSTCKPMKINIFVNDCDNSFYAPHIATPGSGSPSEESQHGLNAVSEWPQYSLIDIRNSYLKCTLHLHRWILDSIGRNWMFKKKKKKKMKESSKKVERYIYINNYLCIRYFFSSYRNLTFSRILNYKPLSNMKRSSTCF